MRIRKITFCLLLGVLVLLVFCLVAEARLIKRPNVAGSFYPSDAEALKKEINCYLGEAQVFETKGDPFALIVPHAGYIYSGPVAASGFKAVVGRRYKTVVVLAVSHFYAFDGIALYPAGAFRTPLGDCEIDQEVSEALANKDPSLFTFQPAYFNQEHSLEVELPFLQEVLAPGFKIVAVLFGRVGLKECKLFAGYLDQVLGDRQTLVVASTDLSHYQPYEEAKRVDHVSLGLMERLDAQGLWQEVSATGWNVCGLRPVATLLFYIQKSQDAQMHFLKYANSGDTAGGKDRVVGYAAFVATRKRAAQYQKLNADEGAAMLTQDEKKKLLLIARASMEARVKQEKSEILGQMSPVLNSKKGAFVTLHKNGALRGCIGLIVPSSEPLYRVVAKMAGQAALHDYRFPSVKASELGAIEVEVSVLSEPVQIKDYKKIRLGTDGVIVKRGFNFGVFLPQVARETGWDLDTFLSKLCASKAGLPADCYKDPSTKILTFQAEVFSEKDVE